jgi:hypothetical protein
MPEPNTAIPAVNPAVVATVAVVPPEITVLIVGTLYAPNANTPFAFVTKPFVFTVAKSNTPPTFTVARGKTPTPAGVNAGAVVNITRFVAVPNAAFDVNPRYPPAPSDNDAKFNCVVPPVFVTFTNDCPVPTVNVAVAFDPVPSVVPAVFPIKLNVPPFNVSGLLANRLALAFTPATPFTVFALSNVKTAP